MYCTVPMGSKQQANKQTPQFQHTKIFYIPIIKYYKFYGISLNTLFDIYSSITSTQKFYFSESMLSFEEFQAVNNRDKIKADVAIGGKPTTKDSKLQDISNAKRNAQDKPSKGNSIISWRDKLGEFLEQPLSQLLLVIVLLCDIFASYFIVAYQPYLQKSQYLSILHSAKYFCSIVNMIYAVELLAVYIAFDLRSLMHLGYLIDVVVTTAQVYIDTEGYNLEAKILNIFRLWRFLRLYNVLVNIEREKAHLLETEIAVFTDKLRQLNIEHESTKVEVEKQREARLSVEKLLQNYKDEVDTLNEALKIAAMDIAEVAQDDEDNSSYSSNEAHSAHLDHTDMNDIYPGEDGDVEEISLKQLLASRRQGYKTDTLRNVLAVDEGIAAAQAQTNTIVVHESGQFEVR